ncbi:Nif3-like dinuclear metal center hexameric protein [Geomonas sp. RF6]|uniref:Nif3-like dinuclear metal center hexameric protein n=1 Tax=Geomonas sp. RF6 TaxID=2897342 RepID=UPI001E2FE505|nr:Nif3-like dinuclear metal center hexameric protein [Geomonas sp. RF6]UFS71645.1 Nif3-like dinuclear metal center hexameric protein [Geomonas sp. RF6]
MITPRLSDIVGITNKIAPLHLAESWDNVGLQVGDPAASVNRIMTALDPGRPAIEAAVQAGCNLLVTHHPFIFTPLKKIVATDEVGSLLLLAIKNDLGVISLHTNYDIVSGGVNDLLAARLGVQDPQPLKVTASQEFLKLVVFVPEGHEEALLKGLSPFSPHLGNYRDCSFQGAGVGRFTPLDGANPYLGKVGTPEAAQESRLELLVRKELLTPALAALKKAHPYEEPAFDLYPVLNRGEALGIGRIGTLPEALPAAAFAGIVKERLGAPALRLVGSPERSVRKVALCGGSGSSLLMEAARKGADLLVTGDLKYHEARDAEALGVAVIDAGHFATEYPMVDAMAQALREALAAKRFEAEVTAFKGEREPFSYL